MFFQKKKYLNFSPFFYFTLFSSEFFPKLLIVLKNSNDIYFDRKRGIVSFIAKRCQIERNSGYTESSVEKGWTS
ncbi:hypothetical protein HMPREF1145_1572 [Oribacterium parvum ACB8]|nr:hypothetical protein HMPREF1145_1572 [Oribacterium parvum ACB8]